MQSNWKVYSAKSVATWIFQVTPHDQLHTGDFY